MSDEKDYDDDSSPDASLPTASPSPGGRRRYPDQIEKRYPSAPAVPPAPLSMHEPKEGGGFARLLPWLLAAVALATLLYFLLRK
jgi:hypothetical protein